MVRVSTAPSIPVILDVAKGMTRFPSRSQSFRKAWTKSGTFAAQIGNPTNTVSISERSGISVT